MPLTSDATVTGNGGSFDPQHAAELLSQTTLGARRRLEPFPPWLLVIRAFLGLAAYGAVWLTVRGQHPYMHPSAAVAPAGIAIGIVNLVATVAVAKRATAGVSGRSLLHRPEIVGMTLVWFGVVAVMVVLAGAGVRDSIVYGLYPAVAPLVVVGLAWALIMWRRGNRRAVGTALAVVAVGAVAAVAGPAGAWAVDGVGVCVVLLASAAGVVRRQHA